MSDFLEVAHEEWRAEITKLDEFFGRDPRYPLASIEKHILFETKKQNEILEKCSIEQRDEIRNATSAVCKSLEDGISELASINEKGFENITNAIENNTEVLSTGVNAINRNIEQINATLDWGFLTVANQLIATNDKLDEIIQLLSLPESQKQRKFHIEQGFDFLRKSNKNKLFFTKSKQNFTKAIEIEDSDYISLQQLGVIHLYSLEYLDFELAKKHLDQSILYSEAETDGKRNSKESLSVFSCPAKITATSMMHLARCYYLEGDCQRAYEIAKSSTDFLYLPEMVSVLFDLTKYSVHLNYHEEALEYLSLAIWMDRYISIKALTEKKLMNCRFITDYLKDDSRKLFDLANEELQHLKSIIRLNSIYQNEFETIEKLVNQNTYLSSRLALEKSGYLIGSSEIKKHEYNLLKKLEEENKLST